MNQQVPSPSDHRRRAITFRRSVLVGLLAVLAALTVSACGGSSSSSSNASATSSGTPQEGGTISYAHDLEPPCLNGGWVEEAYIERQYADNLVSQVAGGKYVPWLAKRWTISPDGKVYTFYLKPGVKFTDGTPLNAAAVAYNFNYWVNPKTANGDTNTYFGPYFVSAKALNDLTVQVTLNKPYSGLLAAISQGYAGILSPANLKQGTSVVCDHPVGSGPWILQKWNHGHNLVFVRNPNYNSAPANAKHQGPAYASKLVWSFITDPTTRWGSLVSSQNNVIEDVPTIDFQTAKTQYNFDLYVTPGQPQTLTLNTVHGVFTDTKVREAFAYAANRKQATQSAFNGEIPFDGNGALSPTTPDYDASLNNAFPYSPSKAAALLTADGWTKKNGFYYKDGHELTIKLVYGAESTVNDEGATALQDLQAEWKQNGFNVILIPATLSQEFSGEYSKPTSYDATIGYWTSPTPAVLQIVWTFYNGAHPNYNNSAFYDNRQLVDTIVKADTTQDASVAKTNYDKAQQIIVNNAVNVGVYTKTTALAWSKNVHDVWIEASQGEPVFSDAWISR